MRIRTGLGFVLIAAAALLLVLPAAARAASANPSSVDFGDVPLNTTVSQSVAITVDSGYELVSASGISALNPPFGFDFGTCTGPFVGPGTCDVKESFTPTSVGPQTATLVLAECPTGGGSCINITVDFKGVGVNALAITTASLPNGTVGTPYPATTLQATGGTTPYTWSVSSGSLPPGLALDPSTGTVSGTPTAAGTFTFSATATDSGTPTPQTATKSFTVAITGVADLAISIAGPTKPVQQSKPVTLTITVQNLGPSSATGVAVTDNLPSGSQFDSDSTSQGSCTAPPVGSTGTVICSLGTLAPGGTATITLTIRPVIRKETISDTATVTADPGAIDPVFANNTATATIQIK